MNEISPLGNSQAPKEVESNLQPHNIEAEQALLGALLVTMMYMTKLHQL